MKIQRIEKENLKEILKAPTHSFVTAIILKGDAGEVVTKGDSAAYRMMMYGGTLCTAYRAAENAFLLAGYFGTKELLDAWESSI